MQTRHTVSPFVFLPGGVHQHTPHEAYKPTLAATTRATPIRVNSTSPGLPRTLSNQEFPRQALDHCRASQSTSPGSRNSYAPNTTINSVHSHGELLEHRMSSPRDQPTTPVHPRASTQTIWNQTRPICRADKHTPTPACVSRVAHSITVLLMLEASDYSRGVAGALESRGDIAGAANTTAMTKRGRRKALSLQHK